MENFETHINGQLFTQTELQLFESVPGNNLLVNANSPHFTVIAATDSYLALSGKKRKELIGMRLFDVFPANPADLKDTGENDLRYSFEKVIKTKSIHGLPTQLYDVSGSDGSFDERYWDASNKPVFDNKGNVKAIIHTVEEIPYTVKARQKEKWLKTIEKEHSLFMQAPIAIQILKGPDFIIELANLPTIEIWNKGKDVIGKRLVDVLPELKEQGIIELLERVLQTGESYEAYEVPVYFFRNGKKLKHFFNFTYRPFYEEDKKAAAGVLAFGSEVTDKVSAKRTLKKAEDENRKLASIIEASHEFVGLASPDTSALYVSPAALRMLGWEDFEGRKISDCIFPPDRALGAELINLLIEKGSFSREIRFWNEQTAEPFWLQWNAFTIKDSRTGDLSGLATVSPNITERKRNEQELKESHERFEASIKAIQGILWTNNAKGEMEGEQLGWAALTGQSYHDYQGFGWAKVVHPDDAQPTVDAWLEALRERKPFVFAHRVKTKNGEWKNYSIRAIPLMNDDGTIREWVGVHTDITEQKKAEQNIKESEERFRNLADDSPMFVFIIDPSPVATVSYWNKTWLQYTGQTLDEAMGRAWDGTIHPDDIPVVMENYSPAFDKRQHYFIPAVRVKRHDGNYRWHSFKGNPRYLSNGEFNGYVGVGFDIHEQKLSEEIIKQSEAGLQVKVAQRTAELQNQKNLLDNILAYSSNGISVTEMIRDENGKIVDAITLLANNAAVHFTGLPKDIYLSKKASEIDPRVLSSPYGLMCLETLETGNAGVIQYYLEPTKRWLELSISKMDDEHLIHIFTDVTPIKEAQLKLEKMVDELKRSNVNLEEFAYAASHDLKEPVRKILFFSDRLKDSLKERINKEEIRFFERMEIASKRMGSLIDDLLSYSQVNMQPRGFEKINMNGLVDLVLNDLDLEIDQKRATIEVENLGFAMGHHRQMQQAFQNLIGNALKYNIPGQASVITISSDMVTGAEISLPVSMEEKEKKFRMIVIADNGIGFEQEDADKIFNVFTRLHSNDEYRGTGVGLSIVRKVIENHNGYITASGEAGKGATFKVYLPYIE